MPIFTKRWDEPPDEADGYRVLVTRYRPRALPKAEETWDAWLRDLGPSAELHAAFYGKHGPPVSWTRYREAYLAEMQDQRSNLLDLAERVANGGTITLLCSSACVNEHRCHRSVLKKLLEAKADKLRKRQLSAAL